MRRRQVLPPPGAPPPELCRFEYSEWADETEPVPPWWDGDAASWRYFAARLRYMHAGQAWQQEHGIGFYEWDRVRGASTPACPAGAYQHSHGG